MTPINPMGWARMTPDKGQFTQEHEAICETLSEILVKKLGIAQEVTPETHPKTGKKAIRFVVPTGSAMPDMLQGTTIRGIPVQITVRDSVK